MSNEPEIAGQQLRSIVERIERLDEEIAELNGDKKEVYAEAKGNGYDIKVLRKVVALRKRDLDERKEEEAILDLYLQAVGETRDDSKPKGSAKQVSEEGGEALYEAAKKLVLTEKKASTSHIQRRLSIGYNKAAALIERMQDEGIVSPQDETGRRRIIGGGILGGSAGAAKEMATFLKENGATMEVRAEPGSIAARAGEAVKAAGGPVTMTAPKPLVSSFAPGRENPFSDDE